MCHPAILPIAAAAVATMGGLGVYQSAQAQKDVAKSNARLAQYAAADAERRGQEEAARLTREGRGLADRQRVSLAGHGLDVSFGTPADLQFETGFFAELDAQTARDNARKEAWGKRVQANNFRAEAQSIHPLRQGLTSAVGSFLSFTGPSFGVGSAGSGSGSKMTEYGYSSKWNTFV